MDGLPVTIRLLDPPLHEFLPPVQILACKEAMGQISTEDRKLLAAALSWSEINPMLGTRGVRLGMVRPGLYEMQVRALMEAVFERIADGGKPIVEIMIPFTVSKAELENARGWVTSAIREVEDLHNSHVPTIKIGTMIETPRAAILADHIATSADFFSFGTNDLTQMTYAFSRDDIESRLMGLYLENALIPHNPFESIDVEGVGTQIRNAISLGKGANSSLTFGVCGEHGGDPSSIGFFVGIGINYVSCSPYRIPSARLAAAHSILKESER
jgi:pyruvate,orthophosphate dikinase